MNKLFKNLILVIAVFTAFSISGYSQKSVRVNFRKTGYGASYKGKTEVIYILNLKKGQIIDASLTSLNRKDVTLAVTVPGFEEENDGRKYYGPALASGDFKFKIVLARGAEYLFNIMVK